MWHNRFFRLAVEASAWSKDPECKVGAVLVSPDMRMFSVGYNGFPKGIHDYPRRLANPDVKLALTIHAEANAILNAKQDLAGWSMYVTKPPCLSCALMIVQAGISLVYCPKPLASSSWYKNNFSALSALREADVAILNPN